MASIYRANLVQDLEPATPDYQALIRGQEMIGTSNVNLLKKLGEVGMSGYKAYVKEDIKSMTVGKMVKNEKGELVETTDDLLNSEDLINAHLKRNEAERKAKELEAEQKRVSGLQYEETFDYGGFQTQADYAKKVAQFEASKTSELTMLSGEIERLREASKGGMSKEEYVARVSALTKKAMAKYPHLSDEIRERVGVVTGLPYADQWAAMQYVKDRFSKSGGSGGGSDPLDPRKAVAATITGMAKTGLFGTETELNALYQADPEKFDNVVKTYSEYQATQAQQQRAVQAVEQEIAIGDQAADKMRGVFGIIFENALGGNVLTSSMKAAQDKDSPYYQVFELMKQGKNLTVHPGAFETHVKMHVAQMRTNIESAYITASQQLEKFLAKSQMSDAKRNEMRKDLTTAKEIELGRYASDTGLMAMASIMANHRDKTIAQQKDLFDYASRALQVLGNNALTQAYFAGGVQKQQLAREHPDFFAMVSDMERTIASALKVLRNEAAVYGDLEKVATVMRQATATPDSKDVDYIIGDPKYYKAAHQAMVGQAQTALAQSDAGLPLDQPAVNAISSAFATSAKYGANANYLMNNYQTIGVSLGKLPLTQQNVIKENVNAGAKEAIINVMQIKQVLEQKYGVAIKLGLTSSGEVTPIREIGAPRETALANEEFRRQTAALMRAAIFSRAAVMRENPNVGGQAFLNAINNNEPPPDFFSASGMAPVPTPFKEAGAGRGVEAGSPGITNYDYETGQVKAPSIYSGTQAERDAYAEQQRGKVAEGQAVLEQADKQLRSTITKLAPKATTRSLKPTTESAVSLRSDIYSLEWLNDEQAGVLYRNVKALFDSGELSNPTRFAKTLKTATDEDKKAILKAFNIKEGT